MGITLARRRRDSRVLFPATMTGRHAEWVCRQWRDEVKAQMTVYRVELERLDHGYEARVPEINGFLCEGLTEGETLSRLRQKLDRHRAETGAAFEFPTVRLEVYRT
jgi:hypothetical protein